MQTGLVAHKTGEMGNGTNANPDETFMIAASDLFSNAAKNCFTMRIGPLKLISISRVMFRGFPLVMNIDLTHDAGVVIKMLSSGNVW